MTPAGAFGPGSPAGGGSITAPGMPPLNLNQASSATSGDISSPFDGSGFSVNYGSGVMQGGTPSLLLLAGAAVAYMLWRKKSG